MKKINRPLRRGDLIKILHFTDGKKKKHYMYRLIVDSCIGLRCVSVTDIARWGGFVIYSTDASLLKHEDYQIIAEGD